MHSAIITTAARTHWRHDFTGRALPRPANEPQAALDTPRAVNCAPGPEQRIERDLDAIRKEVTL